MRLHLEYIVGDKENECNLPGYQVLCENFSHLAFKKITCFSLWTSYALVTWYLLHY